MLRLGPLYICISVTVKLGHLDCATASAFQSIKDSLQVLLDSVRIKSSKGCAYKFRLLHNVNAMHFWLGRRSCF